MEEALRLLEVCKASLTSPEDGPNGRTDHSDFDADATVQSKIYRVIRDLAFGDGSRFVSSWDMETVRNRVFTKGVYRRAAASDAYGVCRSTVVAGR